MNLLIQHIEKKMQEPLPGNTAQYKMATLKRRHQLPIPPDVRTACVMNLLYPKGKEWHIALIQRKGNKNDKHSGQISFPGGKYEASDKTLLQGALRETEEEIGVNTQSIHTLGRLTELYIPVSNFIVHPFVGYVEEMPIFRPQMEEVQAILEVPLSLLQQTSTRQVKNIRLNSQLTIKNVPYFAVNGHVIWGATAMILSEFLEIL